MPDMHPATEARNRREASALETERDRSAAYHRALRETEIRLRHLISSCDFDAVGWRAWAIKAAEGCMNRHVGPAEDWAEEDRNDGR